MVRQGFDLSDAYVVFSSGRVEYSVFLDEAHEDNLDQQREEHGQEFYGEGGA